MKTYRILALAVVASFVAMACTSCVTTTTKVTAPDGTVTETTTKGPDAASVSAAANLGGVIGGIYAHRKIIAEK